MTNHTFTLRRHGCFWINEETNEKFSYIDDEYFVSQSSDCMYFIVEIISEDEVIVD